MSILAAVGGEHEQDRVVEVGDDLAAAYGDELVVLHVMDEEQFQELRGSEKITDSMLLPGMDEGVLGIPYRYPAESESEYNLELAVDDAAAVASECLSHTLGGGHRSTVSTKGRVGNPAEEIIEQAEDVDARYIVVGGRKRSPAGKAIFGSVSQSVILNSDRPVVTITRKE